MEQDTDWRTEMLRRLLNQLHIIMTGILMLIITLILAFSFWNTYQSSQTADITYIQRMASLIIYQLEADTESPGTVLSDYEKQMNVYTALSDSEGTLLYQSDADFPTNFSILLHEAEQSIGIENAADSSAAGQVTEQGGYIELEGMHHDHYYVIPATVSTQGGDSLSLTLVYPKTSGTVSAAGASLSVYLDRLILHHCIHQPVPFEKSLCPQ